MERPLGAIMALRTIPRMNAMQAIMPSSITQLIIRTVVAIGMAVVGVSAIGSVAAVDQSQVNAPEILINRPEPALSEEDARFADRERLRTLFLNERGQLR